jgi:hypothetical protein
MSEKIQNAAWKKPWLVELLPQFAKILVIFAFLEFVILRILNRMSDRYPDWMKGDIAQGIIFVGNVAYNLAFIASILVVVLMAAYVWDRKRYLSIIAFMWIIILLGVQILGSDITLAVIIGGVFAALLLVFSVMQRLFESVYQLRFSELLIKLKNNLPSAAFLLLILFVLATYLAALYLHIGDALANQGWDLPNRLGVYNIAEVFAIFFAYLAPIAYWRGFNKLNLIPPLVGALIFALFALLRSDIVPLVTWWSLGFRFHLFLPLYLLALFCYLFALTNLIRSHDHGGYIVPGLILIFLGGRNLHNFYFIQLAIVGVLFLVLVKDIKLSSQTKKGSITPSEPLNVDGLNK